LEYNVDGFYETAPHALTLPRSTLMCMQLSVPIQPFVITQMPAPVPDPSIAYNPNRRRCILSAPWSISEGAVGAGGKTSSRAYALTFSLKEVWRRSPCSARTLSRSWRGPDAAYALIMALNAKW